MLPADETYDALIIGAGPGGTSAGSALALAGKKVLILEKERFPRFHIGESLIPFGNDELRRIGVWEKLEQGGFMPKLGAEFVLGNARASRKVCFGRHLPPPYASTFQVERARFDHLLLEHAESLGCEVWQDTTVEAVSVSDRGASLTCRHEGHSREVRARWLLDASGRAAVLGRQLGLPKTDLGLQKRFAIFAHFRGVRCNDAPRQGDIIIVRLEHGWFWIIPLDAEKTSVGLVVSQEHFREAGLSAEALFEQTVATASELQNRMAAAKRVGEFLSTGDYTYRFLQNAGPRWLLIGDAAGFVDPIFSSGVMLAIKSGCLAAEEILAADRRGRALGWIARRRYTRRVGEMSGLFLRMIRMFYDRKAFEMFMSPEPELHTDRSVCHVVAGNVDLNWKQRALVRFFYTMCFLQRWIPFAPRLDFHESSSRPVLPPQAA